MISSSPKSVARFTGVTVAGIPILTDVSHSASNIADTISVLPGERDIKRHLQWRGTSYTVVKSPQKEIYNNDCSLRELGNNF